MTHTEKDIDVDREREKERAREIVYVKDIGDERENVKRNIKGITNCIMYTHYAYNYILLVSYIFYIWCVVFHQIL